MRFMLIINQNIKDKMEKLSITEKDIEERMCEVFTYIPEDYDYIDTTIRKNNKLYKVQFSVCGIGEDLIKVECLNIEY